MKYYRFLTGDDDSKFCHKVTEALSNGWELYGSPQLSCLLYTSPSPRDVEESRMPSSA